MAIARPTLRASLCVPPGARDDTDADFGLTELGVVGGHGEIAQHGQLASTAEGEATDASHQRRADSARAVDPNLEIDRAASCRPRNGGPCPQCPLRPQRPVPIRGSQCT